MARSSSLTLRWAPRRSRFVVSSPNQRPIKFSHEPYVGVKWTWNRGRLANHAPISGVLWVPKLSMTMWISSAVGALASIRSRNLRNSMERWRRSNRVDWRRQSSTRGRQQPRSALSARVAQGTAHHHRRCGACALSLVRTSGIDGDRGWRCPCQVSARPVQHSNRPLRLSNAFVESSVERIVAQGARSSSSKAAGPVGRILRDLMLPLVFRHVVTDKSLTWLYEHHLDWDSPITLV
jgi:hypothetical protein